MGIFTGGDKQRRDAQVFSYAASIEGQIAQQRQQRRSILQDIRQARIAQAYNEWAASSSDEYVTASGTAGATGNIFSNFSGAYRYAIDQSKSLQTIQNLQMLSSKLEERAATKDRRAATAAQITTAGFQIAGAAIGGPVGATIGSAVGSATVRAMGGGSAARRAADTQAIYGTIDAWRSGSKNSFSLFSNSDKQESEEELKKKGVLSAGGISRSGGWNNSSYAYSVGGTRSIPGAFSYNIGRP